MFVAHHPSELAPRPRAVALGTFDGVHSAHRSLISRAVRSELRSTVITFHPHPRLVLGRAVDLISSLERRLELIEATGAEDVLVLEFTPTVARLTPDEWVRRVLCRIGTRRVVIGENYRFGHRRAGDADTLRRLGFSVETVPLLYGASSSGIRDLVRAGDLAEARRYLGRPHELEGTLGLVPGSGWALLSVDEPMLLPPSGMYDGLALGRPALVAVDAAAGPAHGIRMTRAAGIAARTGARVRVQLLGPAGALSELAGYRPGPVRELVHSGRRPGVTVGAAAS